MRLASTKKKSLVPHLTLGEWSGAQSANEAIKDLERAVDPVDWVVEYVLIMSRHPDPFQVKAVIWLGTGEYEVAEPGGSLCSKLWGCDYSEMVRAQPPRLIDGAAAEGSGQPGKGHSGQRGRRPRRRGKGKGKGKGKGGAVGGSAAAAEVQEGCMDASWTKKRGIHGWLMDRDERDAWMDHGQRREGCMDGSWRETRGLHGWIMDRDESDAW